jgi:adenylate cyclase
VELANAVSALAARLEAHTKVAGYGILIDDATQRALNGNVPMQSLGEVPFKGKAAAVEIFAVMSRQQHGQT